MFTYDSFELSGIFILLRPVFITILVAKIIVFITVLIPKFRAMYNNVIPILFASIIGTVLSAQLFFYDGIIIDELVLDGDSISFFLLIIIVLFAILNPCLYLWNKRN